MGNRTNGQNHWLNPVCRVRQTDRQTFHKLTTGPPDHSLHGRSRDTVNSCEATITTVAAWLFTFYYPECMLIIALIVLCCSFFLHIRHGKRKQTRPSTKMLSNMATSTTVPSPLYSLASLGLAKPVSKLYFSTNLLQHSGKVPNSQNPPSELRSV